jgi:hypothetical protein
MCLRQCFASCVVHFRVDFVTSAQGTSDRSTSLKYLPCSTVFKQCTPHSAATYKQRHVKGFYNHAAREQGTELVSRGILDPVTTLYGTSEANSALLGNCMLCTCSAASVWEPHLAPGIEAHFEAVCLFPLSFASSVFRFLHVLCLAELIFICSSSWCSFPAWLRPIRRGNMDAKQWLGGVGLCMHFVCVVGPGRTLSLESWVASKKQKRA